MQNQYTTHGTVCDIVHMYGRPFLLAVALGDEHFCAAAQVCVRSACSGFHLRYGTKRTILHVAKFFM